MYGETQYVGTQYGQDDLTDDEIREVSPELMKLLPLYYNRNIGFMNNVQNSISEEVGRLNYANKDTLDQASINLATWGLDIWEQELRIETDISKTYETRRETIIAKLRGSGTVTKEMIKNTALAFTNAEVKITENYDEYSFIIRFVGIKGIPSNMQDFIEMIETIKPAHLGYSIEYTFSWWDNIKTLSWDQINAYTWSEIREY